MVSAACADHHLSGDLGAEPHEHGETVNPFSDEYSKSAGKPEPGRWTIVLVKADGEFVDFEKLNDDFPNIDFNYQTRVECLENGIYRMQTSLDLIEKMHRNDDGSIGMIYTQYLGFLCEELTKEEVGK